LQVVLAVADGLAVAVERVDFDQQLEQLVAAEVLSLLYLF
jgi:hypothetical protein